VGADRTGAGQRTPDRLIVRTVPAPGGGDLLDLLPHPDAVAWLRHGGGLVGWGQAASITLPAGVDRFTAGEKWLRALFESADVDDRVGLPGCGPVAFGSFTFDPASDSSVLLVPGTVIGASGGQAGRPRSATARQPQPSRTRGQEVQAVSWPQRRRGPAPSAGSGEIRWHDGSLSAAGSRRWPLRSGGSRRARSTR
jgi:menaquinone-specific isochorismate synthase